MEISDVRVRLVRDAGDRLKAVCTVTLDGEFVVRDVKVVEGTNGLFVAMPSRKLTLPCPRCRTQNHLRAKHCNECGAKLPPARVPADDDGREKAHRDVAHPITTAFRQRIQDRVLDAYRTEYEAGGTVAPHEDHEEAEPVFEPEPVMEAEEQEQPEEQPSMFDVEDTGVSDYDSLIADLKGGGGPRPTDRGPQRPPRSDHGRRSGPPQGRDRGRQPSHGQGGGNRREGGREGGRDHGRPQGRGGPPRDRGGPRRDDRPHRDRPSKWEVPQPTREPVEQPESDFGASLERGEAAPPPSRPTPPPSRPAPPPPAPKPVEPRKPAQPEPEEDAFGAGLL